MKRYFALLVMLLAVGLASNISGLGARAWAQDAEPVVRDVEIKFIGGLETVNRTLIKANIQTEVGKPRSRETVEQDVRNLIATGNFSDVRVLEEPADGGVKVVFEVQGKATIKEIVFEGQKRFKEERLRREVSVKVGDILSEQKVAGDVRKMMELYQKAGYPDVKIEPQVSIDKDTGGAVVKFKVTDGNRVFIKEVRFVGNQSFPSEKGALWFRSGLATMIKTKHHWWMSWINNSGVLKDDQFQEDLEKIRDFYHEHGFIDMEITGTNVQRVGDQWIVITITISEGRQYKIGSVRIEGSKLFPTTELEKQLKMGTGRLFTPVGLSADLKALEDYYGGRGYLDTNVRATKTPNVETGRMDLIYSIREGELVYIEIIDIRGNVKTKDKVIRRELAVAPGDIYNTVRIDRSVERLKNLGYFSKVESRPEPTDVPNRRDLALSVEEQQTGNVMFGAGFSSIDSLLGFVELTQGNFDLFNPPTFTGAGQKLRLRMQIGIKRQDYIASFTEPWFMDQRLSLGVDLFHNSASYLSSQFTEKRTGASLRLEKSINEFLRAQAQYSLQEISMSVDRNASEELQSQSRNKLRSAVQAGLVWDTRDSVFLTTRGSRTEVMGEIAGGPFGGDVSLYKLNAKTSFYFPVSNGHVLQVMGAVGVVDVFGRSKDSGPVVFEPRVGRFVKVDDVPMFDRFFLGGANTMRGFSYRDVGPRDAQNQPIGGNSFANATVEYTYPIVERVRGALFFDIGNVWRDAYDFQLGDLKSDVGFGVRLNLPIGPLRLDYGYPVQSDKLTGKTGHIQFSMGYQF
jgi:outer membrane protein insertion porin family